MKNGEWLLTNHMTHTSMYNSIAKRYHRLLENTNPADETIEEMSLHGISLDHTSTKQGNINVGGRTESVALSYAETASRQQEEIIEEMATLHRKLVKLEGYLAMFECVMAGLDKTESWIVSEHYLQRKSIRSLANDSASGDVIWSASTMQRRKKELIEKVDFLILHTYGDINLEEQ